MPKKIICFDLDGTLINAQGIIHPADIEILATYRDDLLIPATGRSLDSVRQIFAKNRLFTGQALPFPLVLQNGAALYAEGERVLAHFLFKEEEQAQLIQILLGFPRAGVLFFDLNWLYRLHDNGLAKEAIRSSISGLSHLRRTAGRTGLAKPCVSLTTLKSLWLSGRR